MAGCKKNCCRCPEHDTCTEKAQKQLDDLFSQYGTPQKQMSRKKVYVYEEHPENLYSMDAISNSFTHVERTLEELEELMDELKTYRVALAERYNYIATAPTRQKIRLQRYNRECVTYVIHFYTMFFDGGHEEEDYKKSRHYAGKDRREALKDFEQLKSQYPNAIFEKDIDRKSWER